MLKQILGSFFITIVIILLPVFLSRQLVLTQATPASPPPINITPTTVARPWKIYHNADFNYNLSFPPHFSIEDWDIGQAARIKNQDEGYIYQQVRLKSDQDFFEVLVWANLNQVDVPQFLRWYRHEDLNLKLIPAQPNYHLASRPAYFFSQKETGRGELNYIFVNYDQYLYEIVYPHRSDSEPFYLQMLSNFNFLPN